MLLEKFVIQPALEPQSSYHSPTNLFLMDLNNDTVIEKFGFGNVITRTLSITQQSVATVIGDADEEILKKFTEVSDVVECTEVPSLPYFADKDNAEYVYSVADTLSLRGKRYEEVRRKYNRAKTLNPKVLISKQLLNAKETEALWGYFDKTESKNVDARVEMMAFEKWLMFAEQLPTNLIIVTKNSKIIGFSVVELLGKTLLIHFFRTDHNVVGLAEYLFVEIVRMYQRQAEWINFQQDLGIDGLRKFKEHLQPTRQLVTFIIS